MRTLIAAVAGISLVATACGSDSDDSSGDSSEATEPDTTEASETGSSESTEAPDTATETSDTETTEAETVDATETTEAPDDSPERVVSLSATATEMVFAIDADDLLVAVDSNSNYPEGAAELPNELSAFEPNVEAIAEFEPDLVLIGGDFTGLGDQLAELDIESLDLPPAASISDTYSQIEQLGEITGNVDEAADLVAEMQAEIDEIVAESGEAGAGLSFYHEISDDYFSADSSTFVGEIYGLLGMDNIADGDDSESGGFPQLNAEFIIESDPDVIFLPTGTFYFATAEDVASRPGWDAIAAVQNDNIVETDDEIAGRWGPRIVDYLESVADAVTEIEAPVAE